jgi:hypothetical protein
MKKAELTYKKKNQLLILTGLLALLIIYWFLISPNLNRSSLNKKYRSEIAKAEQAPALIKSLREELTTMNSFMEAYVSDSAGDEDRFVEVITNFCQKNNVTLKELPKVVETEEQKFTVQTRVVIAEGSYNDLLRLIYQLEKKEKVGRIVSTQFKSYTNNKTKKLTLSLTIYLQNLKIGGNNEV